MQNEGAFLPQEHQAGTLSCQVREFGIADAGGHLERLQHRGVQSPFHVCFCCCANVLMFITVACFPLFFAAGRGAVQNQEGNSPLGICPQYKEFTLLCYLKKYIGFCWIQDKKEEAVSLRILILLTCWNPSSNLFHPRLQVFPLNLVFLYHSPVALCLPESKLSTSSQPLPPSPVRSMTQQLPLLSPVSSQLTINGSASSQTHLGLECDSSKQPHPEQAFYLSQPSFALPWNGFLLVLVRWIRWSNVEVHIEAFSTSW